MTGALMWVGDEARKVSGFWLADVPSGIARAFSMEPLKGC